MIKSKKELHFYIKADRMMNRGFFRNPMIVALKCIIMPDYILRYLRCLRYAEYFKHKIGIINRVWYAFYGMRCYKLGMRLGFSISCDVFGYGLVIPHYGTIVVGGGNTIGNYCVLHTSTCITEGKKEIGDALYLSCGAKILNDIRLGDGISIGANSLVNKSHEKSQCLIAGMPAKEIKETETWYNRDGEKYIVRVEKCEELKRKMGL